MAPDRFRADFPDMPIRPSIVTEFLPFGRLVLLCLIGPALVFAVIAIGKWLG